MQDNMWTRLRVSRPGAHAIHATYVEQLHTGWDSLCVIEITKV